MTRRVNTDFLMVCTAREMLSDLIALECPVGKGDTEVWTAARRVRDILAAHIQDRMNNVKSNYQ